MESDSDISEFEEFSPSNIEEGDDPTYEIGSDISVSPVSTPETSENEEYEEELTEDRKEQKSQFLPN